MSIELSVVVKISFLSVVTVDDVIALPSVVTIRPCVVDDVVIGDV